MEFDGLLQLMTERKLAVWQLPIANRKNLSVCMLTLMSYACTLVLLSISHVMHGTDGCHTLLMCACSMQLHACCVRATTQSCVSLQRTDLESDCVVIAL